MGLVQPPVPEPEGRLDVLGDEEGVDEYDVGKEELPLCVGTERWCGFEMTAKVKRARGCWVSLGKGGEDGEEEEGRWWPSGLRPWSVGAWCEETVMEIGEPLVWKL